MRYRRLLLMRVVKKGNVPKHKNNACGSRPESYRKINWKRTFSGLTAALEGLPQIVDVQRRAQKPCIASGHG